MSKHYTIKSLLLLVSLFMLIIMVSFIMMNNSENKLTTQSPAAHYAVLATAAEEHDELNLLSEILREDNPNYGGMYINEKGEYVYLLKHKQSEDETRIKQVSPEAKIEYVKYSEAEVKQFQAILSERVHLGIQLVMARNNEIEVLITEDMYEQHRKEILSGIDEAIVKFSFGTFRLIDQ